MPTINSALGPIDTADLGFTLPHEHVTTSSPGIGFTYPELINRDAIIETASNDLKLAHHEGVDTIVDCSTMDLGRDVTLIREVSKRSGVHIICATGSWLEIPQTFWEIPPDIIADLWVREVEVGIEGTGIKAGIVKFATSDPITDQEELMLRAAARTHKRTGVPITTHTAPSSQVGKQQIGLLEEEGVDPSKVYIGHVNNSHDKRYLTDMMDKGYSLGMDLYYWSPQTEEMVLSFFQSRYKSHGNDRLPGWKERTALVKELIDDGYSSQIMLSHDWTCVRNRPLTGYPSREQNTDGHLWITRGILPLLRQLGVFESTIHQIMVDNPRRLFERSGPL